jgi:DNA-binding NarL/FixJ family response regulator
VLHKLSQQVKVFDALTIDHGFALLDSATEFDLVLLDLSFPEMDGVAFLQRCNAGNLCIPVVIVSSEDRAGQIKRCLELGAMGFIPKSHKIEQMLAAIRQVLLGNIYVPDNIISLLNYLPVSQSEQALPELLRESGISKKQFQVLELVVKGYSNQQIATTLYRTEHTVKTHVSALLHILGAHNRSECAEIARNRGLV